MTVTTLNLPDELHAALKELAAEEHRSVNATLIVAAEEYVQRQRRRTRVRASAEKIAEMDRELLDRLAE